MISLLLNTTGGILHYTYIPHNTLTISYCILNIILYALLYTKHSIYPTQEALWRTRV